MTTTLQFAAQLAERAGELLCQYFNHPNTRSPQIKADRSVVTEADLAADKLIREAIQSAYPNDGILSEEIQPSLSSDPPNVVWIIDPLDGTTNFSLGLPFWGVLITRVVEGWPRETAQYFPLLGERYTAQRGQGARRNGEPIHVKPPQPGNPAAFFACCSRTHRRYHVSVPYKPRILGSAAYSFCAVASGVAVAAFEATPKIWDIAGAWLLVQEAGGEIDVYDGPPPFPLLPAQNYGGQSYPSLAAAGASLVKKLRGQLTPKQSCLF